MVDEPAMVVDLIVVDGEGELSSGRTQFFVIASELATFRTRFVSHPRRESSFGEAFGHRLRNFRHFHHSPHSPVYLKRRKSLNIQTDHVKPAGTLTQRLGAAFWPAERVARRSSPPNC